MHGHNLSGLNGSLHASGYDLHAIDSDPQLTRSAESLVHPWNRTCTDYKPAAGSPVYEKLGFREIDAENIGLLPSFRWNLDEVMRVDATQGRKVQAERYVRMHGLWRTGSSWIGGAEGGCATCHYPFTEHPWARYDHVHADCSGDCVLQLRFKSPARPDPFSPAAGPRHLSVTLDAPAFSSEAIVLAATPSPVSSANWSLINLTASSAHTTFVDRTIFLNMDGEVFVDFFRLLPKVGQKTSARSAISMLLPSSRSSNSSIKIDDDDTASAMPLPFSPRTSESKIPGMLFPSPIGSFETKSKVTAAVKNFSVIVQDNGINEGGGNCSREGLYQSQQAAAFRAEARAQGKKIGTGVCKIEMLSRICRAVRLANP